MFTKLNGCLERRRSAARTVKKADSLGGGRRKKISEGAMRIVCPRCVAQYEVGETAIPESGREVQCANCENIWFQDYLEMLPHGKASSGVTASGDSGVFDDLDGKSEASFQSARRITPTVESAPSADNGDQDDINLENFLDDDSDTDEFDDDQDEDFDDDDDAPSSNMPPPAMDDDVREVFRSEAAFSSARAKLDSAAADALDGDGEARKLAMDTVQTDTKSTPSSDDDLNLDDLTAFLDAHTDAPAPVSQESQESPDNGEAVSEDEESDDDEDEQAIEPKVDPLADLDAIRSQFNKIGTAEDAPEPVAYTPILPADDPTPQDITADTDLQFDDDQDDQDETQEEDIVTDEDLGEDDYQPIYDEDVISTDDLTAAIAMASDSNVAPDDNFEQDRPRRAYRADGGWAVDEAGEDSDDDLDDDLADESTDIKKAVSDADDENQIADDLAHAAPAFAFGMRRPKATGDRTRARSLSGFAEAKSDDLNEFDLEKAVAASVAPQKPQRVAKGTAHARTTVLDRKTLLPDVEELDASLRSEADQPRRRDREMMEAHEKEIAAAKGGGFRRAFFWTVFVFALLLALYVLRPQLVAAVPAFGYVLDPYAGAIDSVRLMIDGLFGG
jgi:predicted Zn finger-like uncharacterized protein